MEYTTGYTFTPCVGSFTSPGKTCSVVTIPDFAMRYLGHYAIRIAILVYRVNQLLDLQFLSMMPGNAIYMYTSRPLLTNIQD